MSARSDCCVLLHRDKIVCSCGEVFREVSAAENHLVAAHDKSAGRQSSFLAVVRDLLSTLAAGNSGADVEIPDRCHLASLPESQLDLQTSAGAKDVPCFLCREVAPDFDSLQDHFVTEHPGKWAADKVTLKGTTLGHVLTTKQQIRARANTGTYFFVCECDKPISLLQ